MADLVDLVGNPTWIMLITLRFIASNLLLKGYIHPDEFFQTTERGADEIFGFLSLKTWEFQPPSPVRSHLLVLFSSYPSFYFLRLVKLINYWSFFISGYHLLFFSRIYFFILSVSVDINLFFYCANLLPTKKALNCVYIFASSCIAFIHSTRSFSNSLELVFFACLLHLLSKKNSFEDKNYYFIITFVNVAGTFIRPTFPLFFFIPCLFFFKKLSSSDKKICLFYCFLYSIFLVLFFILYDSLCLGLFHPLKVFDYSFRNFTVTPINFFLYNSNPSNLSTHGIHYRFTHLLINMPFLFNFLALIAYGNLIIDLIRGNIERLISESTLSWLLPLLIFSLFPHQESRFLIPLILPLVLSHAEDLIRFKTFFIIWIGFSIVLSLFYGFIHQAGLIKSLLHFKKEILFPKVEPLLENYTVDVSLTFWGTYMPPRHLLAIPRENNLICNIYHNSLDDHFCKKRISLTIVDLMGLPPSKFVYSLKPYNKINYLFTSGSSISDYSCLDVGKHKYTLVSWYWPHFSGERIPYFSFDSNIFNCGYSGDKLCFSFLPIICPIVPQFIISFIDQTSFKVFQVE